MKAIMSDKVKKILNDPHQRQQLLDGLDRLHREDSSEEISNVEIGKDKFILKFAHENTRDK
jgi:hypothetical protein